MTPTPSQRRSLTARQATLKASLPWPVRAAVVRLQASRLANLKPRYVCPEAKAPPGALRLVGACIDGPLARALTFAISARLLLLLPPFKRPNLSGSGLVHQVTFSGSSAQDASGRSPFLGMPQVDGTYDDDDSHSGPNTPAGHGCVCLAIVGSIVSRFHRQVL